MSMSVSENKKIEAYLQSIIAGIIKTEKEKNERLSRLVSRAGQAS